ncbi:hypothetical protein X765_32265 [Mesorhizobium sp. LSHC440B00]|nr:hypothetical protein X765_32265 [Mesorhizobium sp. LSHC440B00]
MLQGNDRAAKGIRPARGRGSYDCTMEKDDIALRIEAFDGVNAGGVDWYKDKDAYHLYRLATEVPIARLKPTGRSDEVRIAYWSHRKKWEDIDDMSGCVLPLDQALSHSATNSIFWTWT